MRIAAAAIVLFASATHAQGKQPELKALEVIIPIAKSAAVDRTIAAFTKEGLAIDKADNGIIVSAPWSQSGAPMVRIAATYRATVVAVGSDSSRVILTGAYTTDMRTMGGDTTPTAITSKFNNKEWAWPRITALATAIREGR